VLSKSLKEYDYASWGCSPDFRVGEALRYLRGKDYQIVTGFKRSSEAKSERQKEERSIIQDLQLSGVWLLNYSLAYDRLTADEADERRVVHRFCDMMVRKNACASCNE